MSDHNSSPGIDLCSEQVLLQDHLRLQLPLPLPPPTGPPVPRRPRPKLRHFRDHQLTLLSDFRQNLLPAPAADVNSFQHRQRGVVSAEDGRKKANIPVMRQREGCGKVNGLSLATWRLYDAEEGVHSSRVDVLMLGMRVC